MILFNCDYLEGCLPEVLSRLQETNLEQTAGYGEDGYCARAAALIRKACGRDDVDVHFLVGGTQTNATVISSVLKPWQGVVCPSTGHINVHETGAIEHSGHKVLPIASADGKISAAAFDALMTAHFTDDGPEHAVQPGMLYISFPTELGTLYSRAELSALKEVCVRWGIPMFIDGARLGYGLASPACDVTLEDMARIADVFYIGGTKQGLLFGEAVVICNDSLKKDFRYNMKQNGAMLAKGRLLGLQFETVFRDGLYMRAAARAVELAGRLADALRSHGYDFFVESPTNQIFPIFPAPVFERLSADFGIKPWEHLPDGRIACRICTSWATTPEAVDSLINSL